MFSTKRERESFPTLQSAEPVAIESLNQIARSLVRSSHTTVRAHSQGENNQTNERASARPSALRPSVRRLSVRPSRSKPTHEGTNRVEFRVARARSVRRLVDDRAIDRSTTTETRDRNPRDTSRASTCARRARPRPCVRVVQPSTHCLHTQHIQYLSLFPLFCRITNRRLPPSTYTLAHNPMSVSRSVGRAVGANPARRIDRAFSRFDPRRVKLENTRCRSREGSPARQRATGRDAVVG